MPRPIQAQIDLAALAHNFQVARRATHSRILAVIKANAYGHGLLQAADAMREADGFGVVDIADAVRLRDAGYRQDILLLEGHFNEDDLQQMARHELAGVLHNPRQLEMLDACQQRKALDVWLKIDTGMSRLGFAPPDVAAVYQRLRVHPAVRDIVLMTHFSRADEANAGIAYQLSVFRQCAEPCRVAGSLANSAALLRYPETHADWVRPGIMLYGATPFADTSAQQLGLRPVMTLRSEIISVREIPAGTSVGYGGLFTADAPMRVGTVACGYADGYPRHAPTGTPVLVEGRRTRTLGRVSMDMLSIDLDRLAEAKVGTSVTLWGAGLPVDEVAQAAGTIGYELLCALAGRVPVRYGAN